MKPREFCIIMENFVNDDKRWRALKVGDVIYDEQSRGMDMDYHKMIIDEIDIEERRVKAHDAEGDYKTTLGSFMTQNEFNKIFNRK